MMKFFKYTGLILPAFLLILVSSLNGQSPVFRHYTVDDGLPSSEVYHVIQDSKGYIWFATNNGVSRFDGYHFQNFGINEGLPDNTVFEIFEDYKGKIWFIPSSCKLSYFENNSVHLYRYNDLIIKLTDNIRPAKLGFYVDSSNSIYISIYHKDIIAIDSSGFLSSFETMNRLKTHANICEIQGKKISVGFKNTTDHKEIFIEPFHLFFHLNIAVHPYPDYTKLIALYENCDNSIIFNLDNVFYKVNRYGVEITKVFKNQIIWLSQDRNKDIWVGFLNGGIVCMDHRTLIEKYNSPLLKSFSISSSITDREGGIWLTSLDEGVFYISDKNIASFNQSDGLMKPRLNSVLKTKDNNLYFGGSGPYVYCLENNSLNIISIEIPSLVINKIVTDNTGKIIIGTNRCVFQIIDNKIINANTRYWDGALFLESALDIGFDFKNRMIVGSSTGFFFCEDYQITYLSKRKFKFCERVNAVCIMPDNKYYLGSYNGLYEYSEYRVIKVFPKSDKGSIRILDIKYDPEKNITWLATKGSGIIMKLSDTVYEISSMNGLSNDNVVSLALDDSVVWAATGSGLNKITFSNFIPPHYSILRITKNKGLPSNEINQVYITDSMVYLATNNGLAYFNKYELLPNEIAPPVYITGFKINNADTTLLSDYVLNYTQNNISISFIGLSYRNAGKLNFRYKLIENQNWTIVTNNIILLPVLQPGKYNFSVEAQNEDGIWSSNPAVVRFIIRPPFWKSWWFMASLVFLIFAGVFFSFSVRLKRLKKQTLLKDELISIRQQALSAQMNPHFIFNSLNSIQNFILKNDKLSSNLFLSKFASLIRKILENSQSPVIKLEQELEAITLYLELEVLRFKDKLEYEIKIDKDVNLQKIVIPPLLLQPYLENAIWHGIMHKESKGRIELRIHASDGKTIIEIEDDGIGRQKATELKMQNNLRHKSMGMVITQKRMDLFNQLNQTQVEVKYLDLQDESGKACGTKVVICMTKNPD